MAIPGLFPPQVRGLTCDHDSWISICESFPRGTLVISEPRKPTWTVKAGNFQQFDVEPCYTCGVFDLRVLGDCLKSYGMGVWGPQYWALINIWEASSETQALFSKIWPPKNLPSSHMYFV